MTTDLTSNPLPERRVRFVSPANRVRMLSRASYEDEEEDGEEQNIEVRVWLKKRKDFVFFFLVHVYTCSMFIYICITFAWNLISDQSRE